MWLFKNPDLKIAESIIIYANAQVDYYDRSGFWDIELFGIKDHKNETLNYVAKTIFYYSINQKYFPYIADSSRQRIANYLKEAVPEFDFHLFKRIEACGNNALLRSDIQDWANEFLRIEKDDAFTAGVIRGLCMTIFDQSIDFPHVGKRGYFSRFSHSITGVANAAIDSNNHEIKLEVLTALYVVYCDVFESLKSYKIHRYSSDEFSPVWFAFEHYHAGDFDEVIHLADELLSIKTTVRDIETEGVVNDISGDLNECKIAMTKLYRDMWPA
jgi:hypothetical protein